MAGTDSMHVWRRLVAEQPQFGSQSYGELYESPLNFSLTRMIGWRFPALLHAEWLGSSPALLPNAFVCRHQECIGLHSACYDTRRNAGYLSSCLLNAER